MQETDSQKDLELMTVSVQQVMKSAQQRLVELSGQDIHGKDYKTVAVRVKVFREFFSNYSIHTSIIEKTDEHIIMKAEIYSPGHRLVASGHAEEDRNTNVVNKTSMLENCETSAIGRALASFGLAGDEMASANEIERAEAKKYQQELDQAEKKLKANG